MVQLFDDAGVKRDKFSTKPAIADGPKNFIVRGMAFSACSTKLAIGQSDNIVFVYKLGEEWGDKKSICNKFLQHHPVTSLVWPSGRKNEIVFATADGKTRVGALKTNKASTLYAHPEQSYVVALASSPDGTSIACGHLDGTVFTFAFEKGVVQKLTTHPCAPYGLSFGVGAVDPSTGIPSDTIVCAGADKKIIFYNLKHDGSKSKQVFDVGAEATNAREFSCAKFDASGETCAIGSFDTFHLYSKDPRRGNWKLVCTKSVPNLYTVSALEWRSDSGKLAVGALRGNVDVYESVLKKRKIKTKSGLIFDVVNTSSTGVTVSCEFDSLKKVSLRTKTSHELSDIVIKKDRYVVARTGKSFIVGDCESGLSSEAPSNSGLTQGFDNGSPPETFDFDADHTSCIVKNIASKTLSILEYGIDGFIGSVKPSSLDSNLVSLCVRDSSKKIAYLVDTNTLRVDSLGDTSGRGGDSDTLTTQSNKASMTIQHTHKIDFLELNNRVTHLLFRDKKRKLHLVDLKTEKKTTLCEHVSYTQWVPGADVVVAQAGKTLNVWYSLDAPEKVERVEITNGDAEGIERVDGVTFVSVSDKNTNVVQKITLNESLVAFNLMLESGSLDEAADALEPSRKRNGGLITPETEGMWRELQSCALKKNPPDVFTARRCAAALGNISLADFLDDTAAEDDEFFGGVDGVGEDAESKRSSEKENSSLLVAKLHMLDRDFGKASSVLSSKGRSSSAIAMYRSLGRLDLAAETVDQLGNSEHAELLTREHMEWLKTTGQEEMVGQLKEKEGDYLGAIKFYLKAGLPSKAATCVISSSIGKSIDLRIIEEIVECLSRNSLHEQCGSLYLGIGRTDEALECFIKGDSYAEAVSVLKKGNNSSNTKYSVTSLNQKWGEYLLHKGGQDNAREAVDKLMEAGDVEKACDASIASGEYKKAMAILDDQKSKNKFADCYLKLAKHYERADDYGSAESCFLKANSPNLAVEMHARHDRWDAARKVAASSGDESAVAQTYIQRGKTLEANREFAEAESAYSSANKHDLAIKMYEKNRLFDDILRLVEKRHGSEALKDARKQLAKRFVEEKNFSAAEKVFVENGEWKLAVKAYRDADLWEDAVRCARAGGGGGASKQVAYAWAKSLDDTSGTALLKKFQLLESGVEHFIETGAFQYALTLAKHGKFSDLKVSDIHLKQALFLEDNGNFVEAEQSFIKADKPKEAIDMWAHAEDWGAAVRVATETAPDLVNETLCRHAEFLEHANGSKNGSDNSSTKILNNKILTEIERLYIKAKRPDRAITFFVKYKLWDRAIGVAADYAPQRKLELENEKKRDKNGGSVDSKNTSKASSTGSELVETIAKEAELLSKSGDYAGAVDTYLQIDLKTFGGKKTLSSEEKKVLQKAWRAAVKLANERVPGKTASVVAECAFRLRSIGESSQADDLLAVHGVDAKSAQRYVRSTRGEKDSSAFVPTLEKSKKSSSGESVQDAMQRITHLMKSGDGFGCSVILAELNGGPPIDAAYFDLYQKIGQSALGFALEPGGDEGEKQKSSKATKTWLTALVDAAKKSQEFSVTDHLKTLEVLLQCAHYVSVVTIAASADHVHKQGMQNLVTKANVGFLKHVQNLQSDLVFFRAGVTCRTNKDLNSAFVFLNRYLDIADAIDDLNESSSGRQSENKKLASSLDNDDFEATDVPAPNKFFIPSEHAVDERTREEIRDWVLERSMDRQITQTLPTRVCRECGKNTWAGGVTCHGCSKAEEACVVTGWPVSTQEKVTHENHSANRTEWNAWINAVGSDPWGGGNADAKY